MKSSCSNWVSREMIYNLTKYNLNSVGSTTNAFFKK